MAAPMATPRESPSPRLSVATPMARLRAAPKPRKEPLGDFLFAKSSEIQADDLRVIQELTAGANYGILALVQNVTAVGDL